MAQKNKVSGTVLIVDDDEMELDLIGQVLEDCIERVVTAGDGREGLEKARQEHPDLVITDLLMPLMDGFELTRELRAGEQTRNCAIVVISAVADMNNRVRALETGADDILGKPFDPAELSARAGNLLKMKKYNDYLRDNQRLLETEVGRKTEQLHNAYDRIRDATLETVYRLTRASEFRDENTGGHIQRISHTCAVIGHATGMSAEQVELLLYASAMHDVGEIGIPDSILLKPGKLTPDEWEIMKRHTVIGAEILGGSDTDILNAARSIALTHHEKWDGTGYPGKLRKEEIPLMGRITAVADVFDALTSKRPYKQPFPVHESVEIIRSARGLHFDPAVVDAFLANLDEVLDIHRNFSTPGPS